MELPQEHPQQSDAPACGPATSDRSLLRRFRSGSEDAATELYVRYVHRLRALVRARCSSELSRRIEPEDIVQSVFRRFFRRVSQGDYDVPAGEELWGLFLVLALNKVRSAESFHRAGKRDVRQTVEVEKTAALFADESGRPDAALALLEWAVAEALDRLPVPQRQILELRIQGHEVAEIARLTGRSKRTVERNLQEARARLRSLLDDTTEHEPSPG